MRFMSAFLVLCGLWGCTDNTPSSEKEHTLVLVTSADNPPFEFHRTEADHQEIAGFDIELAYAIAQKLGVSLEVKDMDFNGLIPALQAGRADFSMASIAATEERKKNVDFSDSYAQNKLALVTPSGHAYSKESDLAKKKVGVQLGSTHEHVLKEIQKKIKDLEVISLNRLGELVQELRAGRIDAVLVEESVAKAYVGSHKDIDYNLLQEHQVEFAIAFPRGSPWVTKVNNALKDLEQDGTLGRLKKKWFPV